MSKSFMLRITRASVVALTVVAVMSVLAVDANAQYGRSGFSGSRYGGFGGSYYSSRSSRGSGNSFGYSNSRYRPSYSYGGGRRSSFYSPRGFSYGNYSRFRY